MSSRVTVKTVAEHAGVSVASVSRVLSGQSARESTVERVLRAAQELNYHPAAAAKALKIGRTMQIACAFADIGNPVYVQMVKAIEATAAAAGYRLVIHSTNSEQDAELAIVGNLANGYVDGLIISPLRPTQELIRAITGSPRPVVAIGQLPPGTAVDTVRVDSQGAAATAVAHLVNQGCRRIGFINGPADTTPGRRRLTGYREAITGSGLELDDTLVEAAPAFDFQGGLAATVALLGRAEIDGLFCASDTLAVGALRGLGAHGLCVPDDVAMASIDNTELAELITPPLTSIDLMASERARIATQLILERMQHPDAPAKTHTTEPHLVVRHSSRRRVAALSPTTGDTR